MTTSNKHPLQTQEGILFTVIVDSVGRDCIITNDTLQALSHLKTADDADADLMEIFHAYETRINGVARRLVGARVMGNPLRMNPSTFSAPYTA